MIKERISPDVILDDEGDVRSPADFDDQEFPVSNNSIIQGTHNLQEVRRLEELARKDGRNARVAAALAKMDREDAVIRAGYENPGVYMTLQQLYKVRSRLAEVAGIKSMYEGGEKGGYHTRDFLERYGKDAGKVEAGARVNHKKLVNDILPELFMAQDLIDAGIDPLDVNDELVGFRYRLREQYGGPDNEANRAYMKKTGKPVIEDKA